MIKEELIATLGLYMGHTVRLLLADGTCREGECTGYTADAVCVEVDGAETRISFADIEDLRYKGILTEYHTKAAYGEVDTFYTFYLTECLNSEEEKRRLRYHEYAYDVTCHLVTDTANEEECTGIIREDMGRISATDVLLEQPVYVLNVPVLGQGNYLYTFKNGDRRVGKLCKEEDDYALFYEGERVCGLEQKDIAEVSVCPEINACVIVEGKERQCKGRVSAVNADGFYVYTMNGTVERFRYCEPVQIRYQGVIEEAEQSNGRRLFADGKYWTKQPYLKAWTPEGEETELLCKGAVVSYDVTVTSKGVIAKELCIEQKVENSRVGVVLSTDKFGNGWIGAHYYSTAKSKGNVRFRVLDWPKDTERNLWKNVYVVKYGLDDREKGKENRQVTSMEIQAVYDRAKVGEIHVDRTGNVRVLPFFYSVINQYMDREVCVLWKEEDKQTVGILDSVNDSEGTLTVLCGTESRREIIRIDEIENIRIIGIVTTYYESGSGFIDSRNNFNIKNVNNANRYSGLEGKRVSFLLQRSDRGDGTDAVDIEVLETQLLEEKEIVVVGVEGTTYRVMDAEDYAMWKNPEGICEEVSCDVVTDAEEADFTRFDYPATQLESRVNGKIKTEIKLRTAEKTEKRLFGYITVIKEKDGNRFGFISAKPDDKRGIHFCGLNENNKVVDPESLRKYPSLDTQKYDYPVLYTLNYNATPKKGNYPVKYLKILDEKRKLCYGFLASYRTENGKGIGRIYEKYINSSYGEMKQTACRDVVLADVGWTKPVNVNGYVHFVTYEAEGKNVTRIVDMEKQSTTQVVSGIVKNGRPVYRKITDVDPELVTSRALEIQAGETLVAVTLDGENSKAYEAIEQIDGTHIRVRGCSGEDSAERILDCDAMQVYRVGVLNGVDDSFTNVYINGYLQVPREKLSEKVERIYRTDKSKLVVFYRVGKDGTVEEVLRREERRDAVPWISGKINEAGKKELELLWEEEEIKRTVVHYFQGVPDPVIPREGGEGVTVLARVAKCSPGKSEEFNELWIALEVRREYETLEVEEATPESGTQYCVKRKGVRFPADTAYNEYWQKHLGKKAGVEVRFLPQGGDAENTGILYAIPDNQYENPYAGPAAGAPLPGGDAMFKGRQTERKEIWNYLVKENRITKGHLVILYGQMRCGKSSLAAAIAHDMKQSDEIKEHTVFVQLSAQNLSYKEIKKSVCGDILGEIKRTLRRAKKATKEELGKLSDVAENGSWDQFKECVKEFYATCPEHSILVFIDEFTKVMVQALAECEMKSDQEKEAFVRDYLGFISELASQGITVVYVGHANMRKGLRDLKLTNDVEEKSKWMPLFAFIKDDADELIECIKWKRSGIRRENPYEERAQAYLRFLSGGSPYVLMNLCDRMFRAYQEKGFEGEITFAMVEKMASEVCDYIRNGFFKPFGAFLEEIGDKSEMQNRIEECLLLMTEQMSEISPERENFSASCEEAVLEQRLMEKDWTKEQVKDMLETLSTRNVILREEVNGVAYCRVIMGLYVRYNKGGIKETSVQEEKER